MVNKASLESAIEKLPDEWHIEIHFNNSFAWAVLENPDGDREEMLGMTFEELPNSINAAVGRAMGII